MPRAPDTEPSDATCPSSELATRFPIAGVGASAGGLEAFEALTQRLVADHMAFVLIQHLAPGHESALTDILARRTTLEVVTIRDGMRVEPNRIYVTPPSVELTIHEGALHVSHPDAGQRAPRLSIDAFLRSLANDRGPLAIGVILSGAGTDGTLGLKAIQEAGGITFAQEPSTANHPGMPQSALDAGVVDFCLDVAEIGDELVRLSQHPYVAARPPRVFDDDTRAKLFLLLRGAFGVDFGAYKQTTIERRIHRRMALHRIEHLPDYLQYVQANVGELSLLFSDLLIGVTGFFRDTEPFDALESTVFPRLLEGRSPEVPIRMWVAGCSSGEEAYSLAIALIERLGDDPLRQKIQVFATDIDEVALTRGRAAVYPRNIENDVSAERLRRFFTVTDRGYQVSRAVRDTVVFARHNLGKDPPFSRIDLVSCRNVLIYMQPALQKKILRIFHYALNATGYLMLGSSESVGDGSDLFSLVDRKAKIYAKKDTVPSTAIDLSVPTAPTIPRTLLIAPERRTAISLSSLADRKVVEQYGPPGVVVNDKLEILHYRGRTGRFFEPSPGLATISLPKLVRPELLPELRSTTVKALADNVRVISSPVRLQGDPASLMVRLDVTPLPDPSRSSTTLLIVFDEQHGEPAPDEIQPDQALAIDPHVQQLERELATTKEYLQAMVEELEAANEELQTANEELQSANEELQSTNEELETSKEELQSTNEELVTLNEELQNRMVQLNVSNDDLHNMLGTTGTAIVLVGPDFRIRRFSTTAARLLDLAPGDVGRPIAYLRTVVNARDLEHTVAHAIEAMEVHEQRVRLSTANGVWHTLRITPYRTAEHAIRGAVLELSPAAGARRKRTDRGQVTGIGRAILDRLPHAVLLLDERMCVTWGNDAFLRLFHLEVGILGRPFEDVWSGRTDQPDLWKLLEDTVDTGRSFHGVVTAAPFVAPLDHTVQFSATRLPTTEHEPALTLVVIDRMPQERGD